MGLRRAVVFVTAKFAALREAANFTTSMNGSSARGRNIERFLGLFHVSPFFFNLLVSLLYGSRMASVAVLHAFAKVEGRLDAHQRPVDIGEEDQTTLVTHRRHRRCHRMRIIGKVQVLAHLPLH